MGCYFMGIYIIRCQGVNVKPIRWPGCGVILAVVGWLVKIRANEKEGPKGTDIIIRCKD